MNLITRLHLIPGTLFLGASLLIAPSFISAHVSAQQIPPITFQRTAYSGQSIDELKQRIADGDLAAELHLGLRYATGRDAEQDPKAAYEIFNKYAEKDAAARHNLGLLYEYGLGVERDPRKAFELYRSAARDGNIDATYQLGHCFEMGIGVKPSLVDALKHYRIAANKNHPDAMNNLGVIYASQQEGVDGFPDKDKALEYLQEAIKAGSVRAWANLGAMYYEEEKYAEAFEAYQQGANRGDPVGARQAAVMIQLAKTQFRAQEEKDKESRKYYEIGARFFDRYSLNRLATMYWHGYGGEKNREKAIQLWKAAAALDDASAMVNLSYLYEYGINLPQSDEKAIEWLNEAMKRNEPRAFTKMGDAYGAGQLGLKPDPEKARKHYEQAALLNENTAMVKLALLLLTPSRGDFRKDPTTAKRWLEAAAARDNPRAMFELGHLFFTGQHVNQNIGQALFHFEKAANLGHTPSARAAGLIYLKGQGVQRDIRKGYAYLRMASETGSAGASFDLAMMLENGVGGKPDLITAAQLFEKAIQQAKPGRDDNIKKLAEQGIARLKTKTAQ